MTLQIDCHIAASWHDLQALWGGPVQGVEHQLRRQAATLQSRRYASVGDDQGLALPAIVQLHVMAVDAGAEAAQSVVVVDVQSFTHCFGLPVLARDS